MPLQLLCHKVGMTQLFSESGECIPVTVLRADPNRVIQKKTDERDGYSALQVGVGDRRPARTTRAMAGHFKLAGVEPRQQLAEFRVTPEELEASAGAGAEAEGGDEGAPGEPFAPGAQISVDLFEVGQRVDVIGTSKGRGTTGVVKRHNFAVKRRTHGTHEYFRHGGAIGAGSYPGRVIKGMKMAGRHGAQRVTVLDLEVVRVDPEQRLLFLRGAVPGHPNGLIRVRPTVRRRG